VPPERCPHCGRFLSRRFVAALSDAPVPCPRCERLLAATDLVAAGTDSSAAEPMGAVAHEAGGSAPATGEVVPEPAASAPVPDGVAAPEPVPAPVGAGGAGAPLATSVVPPRATDGASVRPPDLAPDTVRDDVLAGWDVGVGPADRAAWAQDRRPFPTDTVVVATAAGVGLVVGALVARHRARGAALGAVGGGLAGAVARRVWRLEP
jgi:hypothetical protein